MPNPKNEDRGFEESIRILADLETRRRGALEQGPHADILKFARHVGDEFFKLLHDRQLDPNLSKQEGITLGLCVRALTTFYAIVDMLELSLSLQALAIHRSLFDLMLQVRWLHQDPTRCDRYIDYDTLHRWYYLKYIGRWGDIEDQELRSELLVKLAGLSRKYGVIGDDVTNDDFEADADRLINRLRNHHFSGGATGTWYGKSTADLVSEVAQTFPAGGKFDSGAEYLEYLYRAVFGLASAQMHPTPRVTGEVFSMTQDGLKIQIGPDPGWTKQVVATSFPFLYWTFEPLDELGGLDMARKLAPLFEEKERVMPTDQQAE
jgi:hypothetical protein